MCSEREFAERLDYEKMLEQEKKEKKKLKVKKRC